MSSIIDSRPDKEGVGASANRGEISANIEAVGASHNEGDILPISGCGSGAGAEDVEDPTSIFDGPAEDGPGMLA